MRRILKIIAITIGAITLVPVILISILAAWVYGYFYWTSGDHNIASLDLALKKFEDNRTAFEYVLDVARKLPPFERYDDDGRGLKWRTRPTFQEVELSRLMIGTLEELRIPIVTTLFVAGANSDRRSELEKLDFVLVNGFSRFFSVVYDREYVSDELFKCIGTSAPDWYVCQNLDP